MMSGAGGDEAGEGEALVEGEEVGGVVEGVISRSPATASAREGQDGRQGGEEFTSTRCGGVAWDGSSAVNCLVGPTV